jgi:hypothetical protein
LHFLIELNWGRYFNKKNAFPLIVETPPFVQQETAQLSTKGLSPRKRITISESVKNTEEVRTNGK